MITIDFAARDLLEEKGILKREADGRWTVGSLPVALADPGKPDTVEAAIATAVDAFRAANPDVTVADVLRGLEVVRHSLTEILLSINRD
jgi:hypothetical protein